RDRGRAGRCGNQRRPRPFRHRLLLLGHAGGRRGAGAALRRYLRDDGGRRIRARCQTLRRAVRGDPRHKQPRRGPRFHALAPGAGCCRRGRCHGYRRGGMAPSKRVIDRHRPDMSSLTLGFSPCPNDTFIFHALVHGLVESEAREIQPRLEDVERLNQLALAGAIDVTKVSYGVLPALLDRYRLLRSGGALGRGCGPLLVARKSSSPNGLASSRIAIPGRHTTANLLLRLFAPDAPPGIEMVYDRIMPA